MGRKGDGSKGLSKYFKEFTYPVEDILTSSTKYTFHEKTVLQGDRDSIAQLVKSSAQADHAGSG